MSIPIAITGRKLSYLILVLLIWRFLSPGLISLIPEPYTTWFISIYQVFSYLIIAMLIVLSKEDLQTYHIDKLSLCMILLFRTFLYFNRYQISIISDLSYLIFWLISIYIVLGVRHNFHSYQGLTRKSIIGLAVSILLGILFSVFALLISYQTHVDSPNSGQNILFMFSLQFLGALSTGVFDEEPLFRGFLWGLLRKLGWREYKIWLLQAGLFFLAHYTYFRTPTIWFTSLFLGLVLGLLVWKSRSLSTAMVVHASSNAFSLVMRYLGSI